MVNIKNIFNEYLLQLKCVQVILQAEKQKDPKNLLVDKKLNILFDERMKVLNYQLGFGKCSKKDWKLINYRIQVLYEDYGSYFDKEAISKIVDAGETLSALKYIEDRGMEALPSCENKSEE